MEGLDVDEVWFTIGDWLLEPHGGDTGEVWAGFETESGVGALWFPTGDLHLVAHGGETGEVVVDVCDGRDVKAEPVVEDWIFWPGIGDWHLDPHWGEMGDVGV